MADINRDVSIEQVDYNIDVNTLEYSIEINPQTTFAIELNEQGPQGAKGDKGDKGDQGIQGSAGAAGTDGTSAYATVTKNGTTATIVCTDKNGTTSATISDGMGGVDSVNGQTGTVVLTATDVGAMPSSTTIGDGVTTITQNGTPVGTISANQTTSSTIDIQGTTYSAGVGIDITSNTITAKGVEDVRTSSVIKTWTGPKVLYDAIVTKDANTLYNVTDDTDVTLTMLNALYPVGSLYIGSNSLSNCPLAILGVGTWTLKSNNTIVMGVDGIGGTVPVKGNGKAVGMTAVYSNSIRDMVLQYNDGTSKLAVTTSNSALPIDAGIAQSTVNNPTSNTTVGLNTDGAKSGIIADLSNVSTTTLSVKIWERTA